MARPNLGKVAKIMASAEGRRLPINALVKNANPAEVSLINPLLKDGVIRCGSTHFRYDLDPLLSCLKRQRW